MVLGRPGFSTAGKKRRIECTAAKRRIRKEEAMDWFGQKNGGIIFLARRPENKTLSVKKNTEAEVQLNGRAHTWHAQGPGPAPSAHHA